MRPLRLALAALLLVLAVFAALLATDVRMWQDTVRAGDLRFTQASGYAEWTGSPALSGDPARRILGIGDQLAFRQAVKRFVTVSAAGQGFDNGYSEARDRSDVETLLTNLAAGPDKRRASEADNLLAILAYKDSQQTGHFATTPVERSVSDFRNAAQVDPGNETAKFNLEWLLLQLVAKGSRNGGGDATGSNKNAHLGSGGGTPGRGY